MSNTDGKTRNTAFSLRPDQIEWIEGEARRLEAETGVIVSRSAVVRRELDFARKRQGRE